MTYKRVCLPSEHGFDILIKCACLYFGHTVFDLTWNKPLFEQMISIIADIIILVVQMIVLAVLVPWIYHLPPVC